MNLPNLQMFVCPEWLHEYCQQKDANDEEKRKKKNVGEENYPVVKTQKLII